MPAVENGCVETVVVKTGARIELTNVLMLRRTLRLVGESGGALPEIAGPDWNFTLQVCESADAGTSVVVHLEVLEDQRARPEHDQLQRRDLAGRRALPASRE